MYYIHQYSILWMLYLNPYNRSMACVISCALSDNICKYYMLVCSPINVFGE